MRLHIDAVQRIELDRLGVVGVFDSVGVDALAILRLDPDEGDRQPARAKQGGGVERRLGDGESTGVVFAAQAPVELAGCLGDMQGPADIDPIKSREPVGPAGLGRQGQRTGRSEGGEGTGYKIVYESNS